MSVLVLVIVFLLQALAQRYRWPPASGLQPLLRQCQRLPSLLQLPVACVLLMTTYGALAWWLVEPAWQLLLHGALLYAAMGANGRLRQSLQGQGAPGLMVASGSTQMRMLDQWLWYLLLPLVAFGLASGYGLMLILVLQQGRLAHSWRWRRWLLVPFAWPLQRFLRLPAPAMVPVMSWLASCVHSRYPRPEPLYRRLQAGRWWLWSLSLGLALLKMLVS